MRTTLLKCAAAILLLPSLFLAGRLVMPAPSHGAETKEDRGPLPPLMEEMSRAFRRISRQVKDPKQNEATAREIVAMQTALLKAKSVLPKRITDLPEAKRAAAARRFRLRLIELFAALLQVEKAVLEERNEEALKFVKRMEVINAECHEELGVDQ